MIPCDSSERNWRGMIRHVRPQVILLSAIFLLHILSLCGILPRPSSLNNSLQIAFVRHGIPLVAVCSFFENLAVANGYFPGAFTVLAGMASTSGNPKRAVLMYFAILIPAMIANTVSFCLGRIGRGQNKPVTQHRKQSFWLTYWHPQLASVTAFQSGSDSRLKLSAFISMAVMPSICWSIFWAVTIYYSGFISDAGRYFWLGFIVYLIAWTAMRILSYWRRGPKAK
jgi:membrane protein DedA with SNARE-associated domain